MRAVALVAICAALASGQNVYRDIDNTNNNPLGGQAGDIQLRLGGLNFYEDLLSVPRGGLINSRLPSARDVSNQINSAATGQSVTPANTRSISDWHTFWGQYLDHDFILTGEDPALPFPIEVPNGDPIFDPMNMTGMELDLVRSTAQTINGIREQRNELTGYVDGSAVYGETIARANALRSMTSGYMLNTVDFPDRPRPYSGERLPFNRNGNGGTLLMMGNLNIVPATDIYAGGDVRVNENVALACVHTVWVREHNRQVDLLLAQGAASPCGANPTDECLFQEARRIVIGENQAIFANEFSRTLFGDQRYDIVFGAYPGFNSTLNPALFNEFGVIFRYGHSGLNDMIQRFLGGVAPGESLVNQQPLNLNEVFFNPATIQTASQVNSILLGLTQQRQREIDRQVANAVRNTLFQIDDGMGGLIGQDLVARNLQRGRDHGHGSYNDLRVEIGLPMRADFSFVADPAIQTALEGLYPVAGPSDADQWSTALTETNMPGSNLGETMEAMISLQFRNVRDGDMFWYENPNSPYPFTPAEITELNNFVLSDLILLNSDPADISSMQCNAFEDGSAGSTPGGVCMNPNPPFNGAAALVASVTMVAAALLALF